MHSATGKAGLLNSPSRGHKDGLLNGARLLAPRGLCACGGVSAQQGVLVVADTGNATLRSVESPLSDVGRMRTVAGVTGTRGTADGWEAKFNTPTSVVQLAGGEPAGSKCPPPPDLTHRRLSASLAAWRPAMASGLRL